MACRQFAINVTSLLFLNVYSYNFRKLMKFICFPDANFLTQFTLVPMTANCRQVENNAVHQFVSYAKSRLIIWI